MAKTSIGKNSERAVRRKTVVRKVSVIRAGATRRVHAGKTPQRAVRVPDELWERAKEAAELRGENVSQVIKRALARYVSDTERRQAALDRVDRIRANVSPEQRLAEDEALRIAAEERAAMRAEQDRTR